MRTGVRLLDAKGNLVREFPFRVLFAHEAHRASAAHWRVLASGIEQAKAFREEVERRQPKAGQPVDLKLRAEMDAFEERLATRRLGAQGMVLAAVIDGPGLPDGDVPWKQGFAYVEEHVRCDGITNADVEQLYNRALKHISDSRLPPALVESTNRIADFSEPPAD